LVDVGRLSISPLSQQDREVVKASIKEIVDAKRRNDATNRLAPVLDNSPAGWPATADYAEWQRLLEAATTSNGPDYRHNLTVYLEELLCKVLWADGSVAQGVAGRAVGNGFAGDLPAVFQRLTTPDDGCRGAKHVSLSTIQLLAAKIDETINK
jgi:hypothetical protein